MAQTILLLEDDLQLSDTIDSFLTRKGYNVIAVYDGIQAEESLYEKHIDLMLLDIKVPGQDGFSLLRKLRQSGQTVPAIYITSLNSVEDVEKGFISGCDDYIRKPFALQELLVRIESLLRRAYGALDEKVILGNGLEFDLKESQLYHDGIHIPLKYKECKLLSLFLRHNDKLLEYETIYDALWEYGEEPSPGSLRTYIKTLRRILGKERIETVKNVGYRFVKQ